MRRLALLLFALAFAIVLIQGPTHDAAATEQFANTSTTTLSAGISAGATSLTVTSAASFPTAGTFRIRIDSEILLVTAVSGTTFTVTRGAESTTAATHAAGAGVYGVLTAGALTAFQTDTLASAALSASGLYVPLAGNPAVLKSVALDPSTTGAYASQGALRSYFSQSWYSRNSANTGETLVIGTNGGNSILIGDSTAFGDPSVFLRSTTDIRAQPAGTTRFLVDTSGVALNATAGSYGGGAQVVFVGNRTTAPTSNPTGGGVLYAESGELLYRSSAGNTNQVSGLRYGTFANRPTVATQGSMYFATDGHTPWVSDTSGTWHPLIQGMIVGTAPPAAASFTAFNQSTASLADSNGALKVTGVAEASTNVVRGFCVSATTSVEATVINQSAASLASNTWSINCISLRESSTAKLVAVCLTVAHGSQITNMEYDLWTSNTTRTVNNIFTLPQETNAPTFIKVAISGSNVIGQYSRNRIDWTTIGTTATTSAFTTAPNQACISPQGYNIAPVYYVPHFVSN